MNCSPNPIQHVDFQQARNYVPCLDFPCKNHLAIASLETVACIHRPSNPPLCFFPLEGLHMQFFSQANLAMTTSRLFATASQADLREISTSTSPFDSYTCALSQPPGCFVPLVCSFARLQPHRIPLPFFANFHRTWSLRSDTLRRSARPPLRRNHSVKQTMRRPWRTRRDPRSRQVPSPFLRPSNRWLLARIAHLFSSQNQGT